MHLKFLFLIFPCLAALIQAIPAPGFGAPISKRQTGPLHYYRRDQLPVDCWLGQPLRVTFKFHDHTLTTNIFPFADYFKIETQGYPSHIVRAMRLDQESELIHKAWRGLIEARGKLDNKVYFLTTESIPRLQVFFSNFKVKGRHPRWVILLPLSPMDETTGVQCFEVSSGQYAHHIAVGVQKHKGTESFIDTTSYEAKATDDKQMGYYLTTEIALRPTIDFTFLEDQKKGYSGEFQLWPISRHKGVQRFKVHQGLFKDHIVYATRRLNKSDVEKLDKLEIYYVATGKDHHMNYFLTEHKLAGDQK